MSPTDVFATFCALGVHGCDRHWGAGNSDPPLSLKGLLKPGENHTTSDQARGPETAIWEITMPPASPGCEASPKPTCGDRVEQRASAGSGWRAGKMPD
jgi:hypothetical protein